MFLRKGLTSISIKPVFTPYLNGHVEMFFKKRDENEGVIGQTQSTVQGFGMEKAASRGEALIRLRLEDIGLFRKILVLDLGIDPDLPQHEKLDALYDFGVIDFTTRGWPIPSNVQAVFGQQSQGNCLQGHLGLSTTHEGMPVWDR